MRRWLLSEAVVSAAGETLSWSNPRNPGYAYPEVAGLYLSALGTAPGGDSAAAADRVAAWLCASLDGEGGVGRAGISYLFDSAVALAGLERYRAAGGAVDVTAASDRLLEFVTARIGSAEAVLPRRAAEDGRWSTQFGSHQVKCLQGLHLAARARGVRLPAALIATLVNRSGHQPSPLYVHPFCYELEGHVIAAHYQLADLFEPLEGGLDLLVALQQPNGAILAYANGMDGFGEARSDATAQAVRLWLLGDRGRYGAAIARALDFLAACQVPAGGIRYTPQRDDVCSWSTMFTLQAVEWLTARPRLDELL